jgi:hypothetical protein
MVMFCDLYCVLITVFLTVTSLIELEVIKE